MTADVGKTDAPVTGDGEPTPHLWVPSDGGVSPSEAAILERHSGLSRRTMLKVGAVGAAGAAIVAGKAFVEPALAQKGLLSSNGVFAAAATEVANLVYIEAFPTSPLILSPFVDKLPIPQALKPIAQSEYLGWKKPPGPGDGQQNSMGNERHQIWPSQLGYPDPIVYKIDVKVAQHSFTTSQVLPIDKNGRPAVSFDAAGKPVPAGTKRTLPPSTIYGFNGTFPGPMINAEYGKPALVRFSNHLDENPYGLDRQDFGAPDYSFLTHLHNGHTAPESDGNPHWAYLRGPQSTSGWQPKDWV